MLTRKIIPAVMLAFLLAGFSFSQQRPERPDKPDRPQPPTKEQKLDHLTKALSLNDQQVREVDKILDNSETQLDKIRQKYGDMNREMMDQIKQVMENENKQIENKLNEKQKKIFADLIKQRMGHRPPMPPPPPDPVK